MRRIEAGRIRAGVADAMVAFTLGVGALGVWGVRECDRLSARASLYRGAARQRADYARECLAMARLSREEGDRSATPGNFEETARLHERLAAQSAAEARRFDRAARWPFWDFREWGLKD